MPLKGGEPGIWLPLTLNKQLLLVQYACFTWLYCGAEGGTPAGKSPRRKKRDGRMDEDVGRQKMGTLGARDRGDAIEPLKMPL